MRHLARVSVVVLLGGCSCGTSPEEPADASADRAADSPPDSLADTTPGPRGDATPDGPADAMAPAIACPADAGPAAPACNAVDSASFGDCGERLGAAFDGTHCVEVTGCPCDGGDCGLFDSVAQCARDCAAAGECSVDFVADLDYAARGYCGQCSRIGLCFDAVEDPSDAIDPVTESLDVSCRPAPWFEGDTYHCPDGTWSCVAQDEGTSTRVDAVRHRELCAASLLADLTDWYCAIYL